MFLLFIAFYGCGTPIEVTYGIDQGADVGSTPDSPTSDLASAPASDLSASAPNVSVVDAQVAADLAQPSFDTGSRGDADRDSAIPGASRITGRAFRGGLPTHEDIEVSASEGDYSTTTDQEGAYELTVSPGTYQVAFRHPFYNVVEVPDVAVAAGSNVRLPDVHLDPISAGFRGRLVLEGQVGVPPRFRAEIQVSLVETPDLTTSILDVAEDGSFSTNSLLPGDFRISGTADGFLPRSVDVLLEAEQELDIGDFVLAAVNPPRVTIQGSAFREYADDHSNILVRIEGTDFETHTDAAGAWRFRIPPGRYDSVVCSSPGYTTSGRGLGILLDDGLVLDVPPIHLEPIRATIRGQVELRGPNGPMDPRWAVIWIGLPEDSDLVDETVSPDESGHFVLEDVIPGGRTVVVSARDLQTETRNVDVGPGEDVNIGVVVLSPPPLTATVKGRALYADVEDVQGHAGIQVAASGTNQSTLTASDGSYSLAVAPGLYNILWLADGYTATALGSVQAIDGQATLLNDVVLQRR